MTPPETCQNDVDCPAQQICEPGQCVCNGEKICLPGCGGNGDCAPHEACEALRCVGKPCVADPDCPANFACGPTAEPRCARKPCSADAECAGTCVLGACYEKPGACTPPVP